jgi:hypothetical protein
MPLPYDDDQAARRLPYALEAIEHSIYTPLAPLQAPA